ncbi:MAG: hypothetical protein COC22_07255 [Flavobacteriaceae bacterium]|nr:MAG: hypothetical protein COC22_07255 [Flavobacteriaceae bacterium]
MTCEAERTSLDDANHQADTARARRDAALRAAENAAKAAGWACFGEIGGGILGGAMAGALPGAAVGGIVGATACMAGLYGASTSAGSVSVPQAELDAASERVAAAFLRYMKCEFRNRDSSPGDA